MNKYSITKKLFEDKEVFASFINGSHDGIPGRTVLKEIQRESQTQKKTATDHQYGVLYRERGMETVQKSV